MMIPNKLQFIYLIILETNIAYFVRVDINKTINYINRHVEILKDVPTKRDIYTIWGL